MTNANTKLSFVIDRNGQEKILPITQVKRQIKDKKGNDNNIALLAVEPIFRLVLVLLFQAALLIKPALKPMM